jgi:hypothetical protein
MIVTPDDDVDLLKPRKLRKSASSPTLVAGIPPNGVYEEARRKKKIPGAIALENTWVIWYDDRAMIGMSSDDYESNIQQLGSFSTVQVIILSIFLFFSFFFLF